MAKKEVEMEKQKDAKARRVETSAAAPPIADGPRWAARRWKLRIA